MYHITSDYEQSFEEKRAELLELGCAYLGVRAGFLTEIADAHGWVVRVTESEAGGARFEFTDVERPVEQQER